MGGWAAAAIGVLLVVGLLQAAVAFVGDNWPWLPALVVVSAGIAVAFAVWRARRASALEHRWLLENQALERVDGLTGAQFERLTAGLLRRDGFRQVRELGRAGDGGVDLTAVGPHGERFAIQCKRYAGAVGSPEVRNFLGALGFTFTGYTGILVTSGRLTRPAIEEARRAGLILIERELLARWLREPIPLPRSR
ncbi:restriction endonuclease [Sinosporangium album]|uniref:restriction endonuclease n=1 Tax=Sinosporangium album TaxID=504805 RepID=UPI00115FA80B|nr:restriction endonuclease [Sinosporangium album]